MDVSEGATTQPPATASGELVFHPRELLISRTDTRGVIRAANGAFRRLSGYGWDRLIGAPHRVIRHPDMPRGVFRLFWERLQAGLPVGTYVRNREASGRYYWVFAVALPVEGGYLSVRMKPAGPVFEGIPDFYAGLLRAETETGADPAESRAALIEGVQGLGYESYEDFMAAALCSEYTARAEHLSRSLDRSVVQGRAMSAAIRAARSHAIRIARLFDEIRNVPTNIRILAAQLEEGSGPIGVISTNHTTLSDEMLSGVEAFGDAAADTYAAITSGLFLSCSAALLHEVADTYTKETDLPEAIDRVAEARLLSGTSRACEARAEEALAGIMAEARRFAEVTAALKRHVAGLDVTRIMCKIENARFRHATSGLTEIIDNLEDVQAQIGTQLTEIEKASQGILATARRASAQRAA